MPYLIFTLLGVLALAWLDRMFPSVLENGFASPRILFLLAMIVVIAPGIWKSKRVSFNHKALSFGIWIALFLGLTMIYAFRDPLAEALLPQKPHLEASGAVTVPLAEDGHFHLEAEVNGIPVHFLIDTGASEIVLSPADARRVGLAANLSYDTYFSTANGLGRGAPVTLHRIKSGPLQFDDVPASVNETPMDRSLLGMSFLKRLSGFSVSGSRLTLTP